MVTEMIMVTAMTLKGFPEAITCICPDPLDLQPSPFAREFSSKHPEMEQQRPELGGG